MTSPSNKEKALLSQLEAKFVELRTNLNSNARYLVSEVESLLKQLVIEAENAGSLDDF